jgi:serine/threonine-protein kinase
MMMSTPDQTTTGTLADPQLAALIDALTDRLQAGEPVDLEAAIRQYPEHADALRQLLPALGLLSALKRKPAPGARFRPLPGPDRRLESGVLGDYRIVREVGRGGMGVVYEAVQRSLGRRVALKVLPVAGALDPRQLQRFQVEAQAAATLHHASIVPVFVVGCEQGVHFYAMQFIEGRTLADVIRELRREAGLDVHDSTHADNRALLRTPLAVFGEGEPPGEPRCEPVRPEPRAPWTARGPFVTGDSAARPVFGEGEPLGEPRCNRAFFRTVAALGVEAADALAHAHGQGILHRDIKPSNLLLDDRGHLWITDFGLARLQQGSNLTMTGDLLGTLRYMSPEQAAARPAAVDERSDIYALGVTLYELLTLEPAFGGTGHMEILRRIAEQPPKSLRKGNPAVPADLETIIHKAMEKDAAARYATAGALADDLRRFLDARPILARRPGPLDRATKWAVRHRAATISAALVVVTVLLSTAVAALVVASKEHERGQAALAVGALETRLRALEESARPAQIGFAPEREPIAAVAFASRASAVAMGPRADLAFGPDGGRLAIGCDDITVRLFDAASGQETLASILGTGDRKLILFSPDGRLLLAKFGRRVRLMSIEPGEPTPEWLPSHPELRCPRAPGPSRGVGYRRDAGFTWVLDLETALSG